MSIDHDLISIFINSFGRRNFSEMAACLTYDFIFDATIIYTEGRSQFLKFQQKVDSGYIILDFEINTTDQESVFEVDFLYEILIHNKKRIELPAKAHMYVANDLLYKVKIRFKNATEAKSIFNQMVHH
ncbi:MAG: nuclear transport factor 2 family protein [Hyphomicrobiales bacterium]